MKKRLGFTVFCLLFYFSSATAGEADVIGVKVKKANNNTYYFSVTVQHQDTGWKHYANKWDIISKEGTVFGTRILHHPHVNEQPFTRSLSGVSIPAGVNSVIVRAHDSVHKYGGRDKTVELP